MAVVVLLYSAPVVSGTRSLISDRHRERKREREGEGEREREGERGKEEERERLPLSFLLKGQVCTQEEWPLPGQTAQGREQSEYPRHWPMIIAPTLMELTLHALAYRC